MIQEIRDNPLNGSYLIDTLLPSERKRSEIFDVSRMSIRDALQHLEKENNVEKTKTNLWQVIKEFFKLKRKIIICY